MTLQEQRRNRKERIDARLSERYEGVEINGERCFLRSAGGVFHIDTIGGEQNGLVIEFAKSRQEAEHCFPDDGRLYLMDEMTEDEMFEAMVKEIEA